jgi:hypothetical protein
VLVPGKVSCMRSSLHGYGTENAQLEIKIPSTSMEEYISSEDYPPVLDSDIVDAH